MSPKSLRAQRINTGQTNRQALAKALAGNDVPKQEPEDYGRIEFEDQGLAGGWVELPRAVLFHDELSDKAVRAYACLLHYAWNENQCFPGQERMARDLGWSRPSVQRALYELEDKGFIQSTQRGQGKTNIYTLRRLDKPTKRYLDKRNR